MTNRIARVWNGSAWEVVTSLAAAPTAVANYQPTAPTSPVTGQVWINTSTLQMSVWSGSSWVATIVTFVYQSTAPSNPTTGTIWINSLNNTMQVYTGSSWVNVGADINLAAYPGNINPSATNTYDLGTTSLRWRNIYTQDLHLSNGIGDYTVIEGEEDLYITNNKNGKSFKFALIEVDASEVPPKSES
jgi:hypothetical protein